MDEQQTEAPGLQIADLMVLTNLVQTMAQRGAIRAEEMAIVGSVYEKLIKFLTATGAISPADAQPSAVPETA